MDRDYIIAFDENGEPYIAHALGSRLSGAASNARRAGSRYLMKIQTKYGNRYFYTPQEVQAYQRAKSGVKKTEDKTKVPEKRKSGITWRDTKTGQEISGKEVSDRIKKAVKNSVKNKAGSVKSKIDSVKSDPSEAIKTGAKKVAKAAESLVLDSGIKVKKNGETVFDTTLRTNGKKAVNATKEVGEKASTVINTKSDRMREEFRKKKDDVKDVVKQKTGIQAKRELEKEKQNLRKAISKADRDEVMAIKAKRNAEYDSNGNEWYGSLNEAERAYAADLKAARSGNDTVNAKRNVDYAQNMYDNSPLGKAEKAVSVVKDKADAAKQSIKEQVKNLIPGAKVTGNKLVMPSGNEITIPEQFITEQIIPESFIEEQLIKEKKIEEKKSK